MVDPLVPPHLSPLSHKGSAGRLLVIAGSEVMPGAAILCVRAAQRAGAGLVTLGCMASGMIPSVAPGSPETLYLDLSDPLDLVAGRLPAAMLGRGDHARVVGPGMGTSGRTRELVRLMGEEQDERPLVLDADALNVLGPNYIRLAKRQGARVLTPHPGEAARLLGRSIGDGAEARVAAARELAQGVGGICCLKGAGTVISDGEQVHVNQTGGPGLATAGTGDVLAGILGAYLAFSQAIGAEQWDPWSACVTAVHVHGRAGDLAAEELGERAVIASSLLDYLGRAQTAR